jgi:tetratricopeptide (TPR) repeat protein
VAAELDWQVIFGDGLLAYHAHARGRMEPQELLAVVRKGLEHRPDLWHAWVAVVRQLSQTKQFDEARLLAQEATERFPLLPRVWLERADVCAAMDDRAGEIAAIERALEIGPEWGTAVRRLAAAYERQDRWADSAELFTRAVARSPLDASHRGCLADALWHTGRKESVARLIEAVRLISHSQRARLTRRPLAGSPTGVSDRECSPGCLSTSALPCAVWDGTSRQQR